MTIDTTQIWQASNGVQYTFNSDGQPFSLDGRLITTYDFMFVAFPPMESTPTPGIVLIPDHPGIPDGPPHDGGNHITPEPAGATLMLCGLILLVAVLFLSRRKGMR